MSQTLASNTAVGGSVAKGSAAANSAPSVARGSAPNRNRRINVHKADAIDYYEISEHQLLMLESGKRDSLVEFCWGALALAVGSMPTTTDSVIKAYFSANKTPLSLVDQVQFFFVIAGIVAACTACVVIRTRGRKAADVAARVWAQKKATQ
jgi:hypothetical protein